MLADRVGVSSKLAPHRLQCDSDVSSTISISGYRKSRLPKRQGSVESHTCVTFIFIFCFGVRSPCLITASTQRSSSM